VRSGCGFGDEERRVRRGLCLGGDGGGDVVREEEGGGGGMLCGLPERGVVDAD